MAKFRVLTAFKHGARGGNGVQAELNTSRVDHPCLDGQIELCQRPCLNASRFRSYTAY